MTCEYHTVVPLRMLNLIGCIWNKLNLPWRDRFKNVVTTLLSTEKNVHLKNKKTIRNLTAKNHIEYTELDWNPFCSRNAEL